MGQVYIKLGRNRHVSGVNINFGMTVRQRTEIMKNIALNIAQGAPFEIIREQQENSDCHTIYRDCSKALQTFVKIVLECTVAEGHSPFHYSVILNDIDNNLDNLDICTADSIANKDYKIPIGAKYYIFDRDLPFIVTGDGGRLKKTQTNIDIIAVLLLRVLIFNKYVVHCKNNFILLLLSSLGDHSLDVQTQIQNILENTHYWTKFSVFSDKLQCYVGFNGRRYENGDWLWACDHIEGVVGASGEFRLAGLTHWHNGQHEGVPYRPIELYKALIGIRYFRYEKTYIECLNDDDNDFYMLTHAELAHSLSRSVEREINDNLNEIDEYYRDNDKFMRLLRIEIARENNHGFIYTMKNSLYLWVIDASHSVWSFGSHQYVIFIEILWCVWKIDYDAILIIIDAIPNEYVKKQTRKYCVQNKNRVIGTKWKLHTTGLINRQIMQNFNKMLTYAAFVINRIEIYESQLYNKQREYIRTTLLMIFFRIYGLMRQMYGILLIDFINVSHIEEHSLHPHIQTSFRCGHLATYIAYHLFYPIVCLYNIFYIVYKTNTLIHLYLL